MDARTGDLRMNNGKVAERWRDLCVFEKDLRGQKTLREDDRNWTTVIFARSERCYYSYDELDLCTAVFIILKASCHTSTT